jgi:RHS repeat-associated protein
MQQVDLGGGGTVYVTYDATGQRVRTVHEHNCATVEERIYLGGYEVYRKHQGGGLVLERETLHVMDDARRIALVETKTHDGGEIAAPTPLIRYQLGNHLESASLELDETGRVISYEEYHPYGTTAYHATDATVEVSVKRYRYTGKEKDAATGLYYHGARYYAGWLGRWCSADPIGIADGVNLYRFNRNNPIRYLDPDGRGALDQMENVFYGVGGGIGSKAQSAYEGATTLASNVYNDPLGVGETMLRESLPGKILTGDFSGAWNDVYEEGAYALGNVGNIVISPILFRQYGQVLQTGSQQDIQQATETIIDDAAGMLDTGSDLVSFGTKAALKVALKKAVLDAASGVTMGAVVRGKRTRSRPDRGSRTDTGSDSTPPFPADFVDDVSERPGSFNPGAAKRRLLDEAPGDSLLQRSHLGRRPFTPTDSPEITLSGHGTFDPSLGFTRIPENTWLNLYGRFGRRISNDRGNLIERGLLDPLRTYGPGDVVPNLRLTPGLTAMGRLKMVGDPIFVNPTRQGGLLLSDMLRPNLGPLNWAACLTCPR